MLILLLFGTSFAFGYHSLLVAEWTLYYFVGQIILFLGTLLMYDLLRLFTFLGQRDVNFLKPRLRFRVVPVWPELQYLLHCGFHMGIESMGKGAQRHIRNRVSHQILQWF